MIDLEKMEKQLLDAPAIGIDIETCDPDLKKTGSGVRRTGFICGLSLSDKTNSFYLPVNHEQGFNYEPDIIRSVTSRILKSDVPKVGANIIYDLEYLSCWGCTEINGALLDVQVAEPLLDETALSYSLETLAKKYSLEGKKEIKLQQWASENLSKSAKVKSNIWRMPSELVAEYAEQDALLPLMILERQRVKLEEEDLSDLFHLESRLLEMLLAMKLRGVKVDLGRTLDAKEELTKKIQELEEEVFLLSGLEVNVYAAASIAAACDKLGLSYNRTAKTNAPSFTKAFLDKQTHPLFSLVAELKLFRKMRDTFLESILTHTTKGRIHCQFNQLKSDDFGTVTGRFSSSNPNLQQIPTRNKKIGNAIRSLFVPDPGETWYKMDYSAIEPRLSVHYSKSKAAQKIIDAIAQDKEKDIYQTLMEELPELDRGTIKTIYLGISYCMGNKTLSSRLGVGVEEGAKVLNAFNQKLPFLKNLSNAAIHTAKKTGEIQTLLGRKRRFNQWESSKDWGSVPLPSREEAKKAYGGSKRAFTYRAFNSIIQGGSADILKKAMVNLWDSGIFNEIGVPLLTVHDELDFSIPKGKEHLIKEVKNIMENPIELRVLLNVDVEKGPNWGEVK